MPLSAEIQQFIRNFGNTWSPDVNSACEHFFEDQHVEQERNHTGPEVEYIKGVKYGPDERNRLDIYNLVEDTRESASLPVVVYFHGGGFVAGDNDITPHMHGNIARFFASYGMIGVLATYLLLPEARFPEGALDVSRAFRWLAKHIGRYGGDPRSIFLIGQSAGGAHLAMALWSGVLGHKEIESPDIIVPRGIVLQSMPFWYDLSQERRRNNMQQYYGTTSEEEILSRSPGAIFRHASDDTEHYDVFGIPVYVTVGELDSEEIVKGNMMFVNDSMQLVKRLPLLEVLEGHNHISYALSIGLEGDEVGPRIVRFIRNLMGMADNIPEPDQPGNRDLLRTNWFPLVRSEPVLFLVIVLLVAFRADSINRHEDGPARPVMRCR
ncbi:alpha/beta-hydrolase [Aspergillus karnatakaensis]|uniref:alpha/beta hydrolase n=1 Tax=Aspergillus karnatakaensis TaxID=1810916 RepID=UPI003CCDCD84